jgi:serine/threonine protein kinase
MLKNKNFNLKDIEILDLIKCGGQSNVYIGKLMWPICQLVVIKIYKKDLESTAFGKREILILSNSCHPYVVKLLGYFKHKGKIGLVLELLHGVTLAGIIAWSKHWKKTINVIAFKYLVCQSLIALNYLHCALAKSLDSFGLVHGDLSPDNLFLTSKGEIKLIDFGASEFLYTLNQRKTFGKRKYLAPEVLQENLLSFRSDLYSLAVSVSELLTLIVYEPAHCKMFFKNMQGYLSECLDLFYLLKSCLSPSPFYRPKTVKRAWHLLSPLEAHHVNNAKLSLVKLIATIRNTSLAG